MPKDPFLAALSLLVSTAVMGQAPAPQPGTRVRITFPCEPAGRAARPDCRAVGSLVELSADTIAVDVDGATTRYSLNALTRLELSRGRKSHWLPGAGVGFLVGAGAAFAILYSGGSTSSCDRSANQDAMRPGECIGLTALGGLAGAGIGAAVGALVRTERWQDIPVEPLRVGLVPRLDGGIGAAFVVRF